MPRHHKLEPAPASVLGAGAGRPSPPGAPPLGPVSELRFRSLRTQHNLLVPMRDGTHLALDLIGPDAPGSFPVVLVRTPYDKVRAHGDPFYRSLAERGYAVALQDCRGRFNSDGEFFPWMDERPDGYDTVEWIAAQEWCDGNVGMAGRSYVGQTQWLAAAEAPPHLRAIVPICAPPDLFVNEPVANGALLLPMAEWMVKMGRRSFQVTDFLDGLFSQHEPYFDALPLSAVPAAAGTSCSWWDEIMRHPAFDSFWRRGGYQEDWRRMRVAALNVTGWYDMNFPGAPLNFGGLRGPAAPEAVRAGQKLVIGPWAHIVNVGRSLSGLDLGEHALVDLETYALRFYDRWLRGIRNGIDDEPPVYVFVLGANEWWSAESWPLPQAEERRLYLHSRGVANGSAGDGALSFEPPGAEPPDRYRYDPARPAGSVWGMREGPIDDRPATERDDVLCYTSATLAEALDVVGPVSICLCASSSALDTDWHVRLADVHPDGVARYVCHGVLRARFRDSLEEPELLEPGKAYAFRFGLDATGTRFLPGHRLRVEVASSWFPRYDRNMNSGAPNPFLDDRIVVAEQTVYHEAGRASHLVLPVIPARS